MRVTFFGTSHGVPEPNRKCSCIMLEAGDKKYLIDAGTNPIDALVKRNIAPERINAVFITHTHGDHIDGLIPFVDLCCWKFKNAEPVIYLPEMAAADAIKTFIGCLHVTFRDEIRFEKVTEGAFYDDGTLKVTAFKTGHMEYAYAYLCESEGKKLLFTGDLKHGDGAVSDYERFVPGERLDLVVAEGVHFDACLYKEPLLKNPPKLFCFNHYSLGRMEPCLRLKRELNGEVDIVFATDDLELNV